MKWQLGLIIVLVTLLNSCTKSKTTLPTVMVLGHAGTSLHRDRAVFPANSFKSIQYAIDVLDADGVEVDVQMTRDSILVLYHDKYLNMSTNYKGCISQYNFDELKNVKLDHTNYPIVTLEVVLKYIQKRNKSVYLDLKAYDFCENKNISITRFNYALMQSFSGLSEQFKNVISVGMSNPELLNQVNHSKKCLEFSNVKQSIEILENYNFTSVLFNLPNVSKSDRKLLVNKNINWGVINIKDEWTIDKAIKINPNFVITDNIAYTQKVTN